LHHKFVARLEDQSKALQLAKTKRDVTQMNKEFAQDLERDMEDLKEALQLRVLDTLSTREVITTVLAATASFSALMAGSAAGLHEAALATGGVLTLGGLVATASKMFASRRNYCLNTLLLICTKFSLESGSDFGCLVCFDVPVKLPRHRQ
jgi:hypothetical protein